MAVRVAKNLQHNFPKMREGSKAVWNFSENSSDLVAWPVPKGGATLISNSISISKCLGVFSNVLTFSPGR